MKAVFINVWYLLLTIIRLVLKNKDDSNDKVG